MFCRAVLVAMNCFSSTMMTAIARGAEWDNSRPFDTLTKMPV